jgi:hypothetical protein
MEGPQTEHELASARGFLTRQSEPVSPSELGSVRAVVTWSSRTKRGADICVGSWMSPVLEAGLKRQCGRVTLNTAHTILTHGRGQQQQGPELSSCLTEGTCPSSWNCGGKPLAILREPCCEGQSQPRSSTLQITSKAATWEGPD